MSLGWNIDFEIASFIVLTIFIITYSLLRKIDNLSTRLYTIFMYETYIAIILNIATVFTITYSDCVPVILNVMLNILYLLIQNFIPFTFYIYIMEINDKFNSLFKGFYLWITTIPASITLLLLVTAPFTNLVFYFDLEKPHQYHTGIGMYLLYLMAVWYLAVSIIITFRNHSNTLRSRRIITYNFLLVTIAALLLQQLFPNLLLTGFASTVGIIVTYLNLQIPDNYTDNTISSLFNRNAFFTMITEEIRKNKHFSAFRIYIDGYETLISSFGKKNIHALLYEIASELIRHFPNASIYHFDTMKIIVVFKEEEPVISGNVIDTLTQILTSPRQTDSRSVTLTSSVCCLNCPEDATTITEIIDIFNSSLPEENEQPVPCSIVYAKDFIIHRENKIALLMKQKNELEILSAKSKEAKLAAERADKAKTTFLANMSHEIRTPMNAIVGMSELLLKDNISKDVREKVENIRSAGNSLLSIVNDILDFSKIESGKFEIIESPYDVQQLVTDIINIVSNKAYEKDLEILTEINENIPCQLIGDAVRIRQIFINLLNNSVKFTKQGYVKLKLDYEAKEDFILLKAKVIDSGIGIRKEDLGRLFDSFQQLDTKQNYGIEGSGLGLSICQNLVKNMKGSIFVESEYGKGSCFSVVLPQKIADTTPLKEQKASSNVHSGDHIFKEGFTAPTAHLLIVDDNRLNLAVAKGLLSPYQCQITTALSGNECLWLLQTNTYDIIFMDHMMPEMDGIETLNQIRLKPDLYSQNVPVIALTANAVSGMKERFLAAGFQDYISKPIDVAALEQVLFKFLPKDYILPAHTIPDADADSGQNTNQLPVFSLQQLEQTKAIDTTLALSHFRSEAEYLESFSVFYAKTSYMAAQLKTLLESNNYTIYSIFLDDFVQSCSLLGLNRLEKLGKAQQKALQEENYTFLSKNLPFLLKAFQNLFP